MAGKMIILKFDANCFDCGAFLPAGTKARWYGKGRVYGQDCHAPSKTKGIQDAQRNELLGLTLSRNDRYGVYTVDGQKIGSTCNCEDYPCCGH